MYKACFRLASGRCLDKGSGQREWPAAEYRLSAPSSERTSPSPHRLSTYEIHIDLGGKLENHVAPSRTEVPPRRKIVPTAYAVDLSSAVAPVKSIGSRNHPLSERRECGECFYGPPFDWHCFLSFTVHGRCSRPPSPNCFCSLWKETHKNTADSKMAVV